MGKSMDTHGHPLGISHAQSTFDLLNKEFLFHTVAISQSPPMGPLFSSMIFSRIFPWNAPLTGWEVDWRTRWNTKTGSENPSIPGTPGPPVILRDPAEEFQADLDMLETYGP